MDPPPKHLPPANSRKWHANKWLEPLGYLRVRHFTDPEWPTTPSNVDYLVRQTQEQRDHSKERHRELLDQILAEARRYQGLRRPGAMSSDDFAKRRHQQWERVVRAVDDYLTFYDQFQKAAIAERARLGRADGDG